MGCRDAVVINHGSIESTALMRVLILITVGLLAHCVCILFSTFIATEVFHRAVKTHAVSPGACNY